MKPWHILTVILLLIFGGGMMSAQTGYDPPLPAEPQGETPFNPDLPSEPQGDDTGNDPFNPDLPSEPQGDEPGDEPFNPDLPSEPQGDKPGDEPFDPNLPSEPQGSVFFTVTFRGFDNALLSTQRVEQGKSAAAPDAPDVEGYTFIGWDKDFDNVQSDLTVTAIYEKDFVYYTVTWRNYDGSLLSEEDVEEGSMPVYAGIEPTKPADAQYTYTFAGWSDGTQTYGADDELPAVTANATYTAVFESVAQCGTIETTDGATVWEDELPYTWEGETFTEAGSKTKTLKASDGCDSVVTFTLRVRYHNIVLQENEDAQYYNMFAEDYNGQTVTTATLNRQFSNGKWATLCLPFEVRKGQMTALGLYGRVFEFRYAELSDAVMQVYFSVAQFIEAGKGYIVSANAKLAQKTSFVFSNVRINTNIDNGDISALTGYNDNSGRCNLYLIGTLRTGLLTGTGDGNTYLGLKDNKLYYPNTTVGTSIRAYRGFFRSSEAVNISKVRIVAEGETVTELEVVDGEVFNADGDGRDPSVRKFIKNGILYIERNGKIYTAPGMEM